MCRIFFSLASLILVNAATLENYRVTQQPFSTTFDTTERNSDNVEITSPLVPYSFGYQAELEDGSSSRQESSDGKTVTGYYTLKGPDGINRVVHYIADVNGFRASIATNEQGTESKSPAAINFRSSQLPASEISRTYRAPYRTFSAHSYDVKSDDENVRSKANSKFNTKFSAKSIPKVEYIPYKETTYETVKTLPTRPEPAPIPESPSRLFFTEKPAIKNGFKFSEGKSNYTPPRGINQEAVITSTNVTYHLLPLPPPRSATPIKAKSLPPPPPSAPIVQQPVWSSKSLQQNYISSEEVDLPFKDSNQQKEELY